MNGMIDLQETPGSFELFYKHFFPLALGYVMKRINNIHDAEDLTSDVFLYCYKHFSEYNSKKSSLSTWLFLIVNCRIKNYYRDQKEYTDIDELENLLPDISPSPEHAMELELTRNLVARAISALPMLQRKIVVLRYFAGKTTVQIAREVDLSPGNVRTILSRALDKLEKYIKERET